MMDIEVAQNATIEHNKMVENGGKCSVYLPFPTDCAVRKQWQSEQTL